MRDGSGSPYVRIFTSLGEVTSRIVDFVYKYSQEEDDTCQLRIEDKDPMLADRPEFQEGAILKVTWGYMGEDKSKTREVKIRNVKAGYTTTCTSLDLLCTDRVSDIKHTSSKKVHKGNLSQIANDIAKRNGLHLQTEVNPDGSLSFTATGVKGQMAPGYYDEDKNWKTQVDNTSVPRFIYLRIFDGLPQANKSDHAILKEAADNDPNGPWELVGRDNKLTVQRKNLRQKPLRSYTWEGGDGELIDFFPESKNYTKRNNSMNISTTVFNPEKKEAYAIDTNEFTNKAAKLGSTVDASPRAINQLGGKSSGQQVVDTGEDQKEQVKVLQTNHDPYGGNSPTLPTAKIQANVNSLNGDNKPKNSEVTPGKDFSKNKADKFSGNYLMEKEWGIVNFATLDPTAPSYQNSLGNFTSQVATTAVVKNIFTIAPIDYNKHIPSEEHSLEDGYAKAANHQAISSLEKNPAEIKVVGFVDLESGKVLTILKVANKHAGNYYIKECIHRITPNSAYLVEMKGTRNATGSTKSDSPLKLNVDRFDTNTGTTTVINKDIGKNDQLINNETTLQEYDPTSPIPSTPGATPGLF